MSDRRAKKALRRERRKAKKAQHGLAAEAARAAEDTEIADRIGGELDDPDRRATDLRRLGELLRERGDLSHVRIGPDDMLAALLSLPADTPTDLPEPERAANFRRLLFEKLSTAIEEAGHHCWSAINEAGEHARSKDDRMALLAGELLLERSLHGEDKPITNFVWQLILELSLEDVIQEGTVLSRIARRAKRADESEIAAHIAAGKAELAALNLSNTDPAALASRLTSYLSERAIDSIFELQVDMDAVLNLIRASRRFCTTHADTIRRFGLTTEVRQAAVAAFDDAFGWDVSYGVIDELKGRLRAELRDLENAKPADDWNRGSGSTTEWIEDERLDTEALLASLVALPRDRNPFLRELYLDSFSGVESAAMYGEDHYSAIWEKPEDAEALASYERTLLADGADTKAARVRRYREALSAASVVAAEPATTAP